MAAKVAGVLHANGALRALVVYGHDGLDELTTTTTSTVVDVDADGHTSTYDVDPAVLGLSGATGVDLQGGDAAANAVFAGRVLAGAAGPHRDIVVLNAGAALVAAGLVDDLGAGVAMASAVIDDGRAADALVRLVQVSQAAASDAAG
jgi:anthranilate phosphoribosyltransferase